MNSDETIEMLYDFQAGDPNHFGRWAEDEVYDGINTAIEALRQYQPWVSVSERLPDDGIPVLVTYIGFSDGKPYSDGVAKWSIELNAYNGGWAWTIDGSDVTVEITHWKPLPEPPKGE